MIIVVSLFDYYDNDENIFNSFVSIKYLDIYVYFRKEVKLKNYYLISLLSYPIFIIFNLIWFCFWINIKPYYIISRSF